MKRLPAVAFGLLVLATIGAFFLAQHLKVANPLVWGDPKPKPAAIDPVAGRICTTLTDARLDYRRTKLSITVSRTDSVGVYIVNADDANGPSVATISTGTPMTKSVPGTSAWYPRKFTWNGRLADGQIAPDGTYFFRIVLLHEDLSINLSSSPVRVVTRPPSARVLSVTVSASGAASGSGGERIAGPAILSPPHGSVTIRYTPGSYRRVWLDIYRTDVSGKPQLVTRLKEDPTRHTATWNGEIDDQPAPAGTYLVGITAQNLACDQASWPVVLPPAPGTTPDAGVTIRYLSVTSPLAPVAAGSKATVAVDSPVAAFTWKLRRAGTAKVLAHGAGGAGATQLSVPLPEVHPGLYTLAVSAGKQRAVALLVASVPGRTGARARVLVVLPALTWEGESPVDDTGDGVPDTLTGGSGVTLARPLVDGSPASLDADAALLSYLDEQHLSYQLTTDVALAEGAGPSLVDRWGVVFPDGEEFLPAALKPTLTGFVRDGGRLLALGTRTFAATSQITGYPSNPEAAAPVVAKVDPFGAQRGPLTPTGGELITELADPLHLLGDAVAFTGFSEYQPIEPPVGVRVSAAGIADGSAAIVAFPVGLGTVVEIGLPNFGASLAHDVDSRELFANVWRRLAKLG